MKKRTIYAIPGLGVDERIFYDLALEADVQYLNWIQPDSGESLRTYAKRIVAGIPQNEPIYLLGMSFGGVVAQEIVKFRPVSKLVLISSIKSSKEKPWQLELMKYVPLYYASVGSLRVKAFPWLAPSFGIHKKEEIKLLQDMFQSFDDTYRMWAIKQMCEWEGEEPAIPFLHLHGDADKVFPIKNIRDPQVIVNGNHFMVKQRAKEVSEKINAWLGA